MVCEHLRHLYQLCVDQEIRLSSSELVHFVCTQCNSHDTCPSNLMTDVDDDEAEDAGGTAPGQTGNEPPA